VKKLTDAEEALAKAKKEVAGEAAKKAAEEQAAKELTAAKFRYRASDKSIATVTKSGKIKGINKGTCTVYVYAINGKMKKVKVTVK
jgi:uncharacterized protein YjdB